VKTISYNKSGKPQFSAEQERDLQTLRAYIAKMRELGTSIAGEFQGEEARAALSKIEFEIKEAAEKIAILEIQKVQASLGRPLP